MLEQTASARPEAARPDPLPAWAFEAFPDGLARQSEGVWAPRSFTWGLAEQARTNVSAVRRAGGGPAVSQHFEHLLRTAIDRACPDVPSRALLLDLRSGDGTRSVTPWLNVLPDARIVASDPAGILLATMVSRAATVGDEDRVMGVVAEPDRVPVAPASFDVVSGVACLHELDDPDLVLAAAARALRPGGYAIFLAPFDGHGILRSSGHWMCAACETSLGPVTGNAKEACSHQYRPLAAAGPLIAPRTGGESRKFRLSEYSCPNCGTLLAVDQTLKTIETHWHDVRPA